MGLKKLFTAKEKEEKVYDRRLNSSRASTISHAISNWTHKSKRQSLDINQPSPDSSTSFVSSPTTLTPTSKVTQNDEPVVHRASSRPITPSDSIREVYEEAHVLPTIPANDTIPIVTPDRHLTMDSDKFEVADDDDSQYGVVNLVSNHVPTHDGDDVGSATKDSLYQELLLVKQQLDTVNPNNAVYIKRRLDVMNQLLTNALDSSSRLDTKLKSVIETSKQTMIAVKDENVSLKSNLDDLREEYQGQIVTINDLQTKLDEYNDTQQQLSLLFDNEPGNLQDKIKRMLACNGKQTEEIKLLKDQVDALQMKAENGAMIIGQFTNQKLELESCTTQIKDLQAENTRLLAEKDRSSELAILKEALESTKEENLELQSNVQETQTQLLTLKNSETASNVLEAENRRLRQELTDMEAVSREATKAVIDENEKLESRVREMDIVQQENSRLREMVENLKVKQNELSKEQTSVKTSEQDELMRMHTRAQLGLIEYLEGEENVPLAMGKFKKQLEAEMKDLL